MKIIFIRHGMTSGNLKKRYIGRTDEPLCQEGIEQIRSRIYPAAEQIISSPMKRCIETARLIYPKQTPVLCEGLQECDFGEFEGKNYKELTGNANYQKWIDSNGLLPFPAGEAHEDFKKRCCAAFQRAIKDYAGCDSLTFVVHGGTIMSILEQFARPQKGFYDYQVKNGAGFVMELKQSTGEMEIISKL